MCAWRSGSWNEDCADCTAMHCDSSSSTIACSTIKSSARSATSSYTPSITIRGAETALWLVDPIEYATAERLYDGDSYLIACELGVTVQVVEDYKSLLASRTTVAYGERTVE